MLKIPPEVERQLGIYVCAYIDPRDGQTFYIGKGQAGRTGSHLTGEGEGRKIAKVQVCFVGIA